MLSQINFIGMISRAALLKTNLSGAYLIHHGKLWKSFGLGDYQAKVVSDRISTIDYA